MMMTNDTLPLARKLLSLVLPLLLMSFLSVLYVVLLKSMYRSAKCPSHHPGALSAMSRCCWWGIRRSMKRSTSVRGHCWTGVEMRQVVSSKVTAVGHVCDVGDSRYTVQHSAYHSYGCSSPDSMIRLTLLHCPCPRA